MPISIIESEKQKNLERKKIMKTTFLLLGLSTVVFFGLPYALTVISLFNTVIEAFNF
jgi:hypothetical protein